MFNQLWYHQACWLSISPIISRLHQSINGIATVKANATSMFGMENPHIETGYNTVNYQSVMNTSCAMNTFFDTKYVTCQKRGWHLGQHLVGHALCIIASDWLLHTPERGCGHRWINFNFAHQEVVPAWHAVRNHNYRKWLIYSRSYHPMLTTLESHLIFVL